MTLLDEHETDGPRSGQHGTGAIPPTAPPEPSSGRSAEPPASDSGTPADAGRGHDPADAAPHFTTETGADKT